MHPSARPSSTGCQPSGRAARSARLPRTRTQVVVGSGHPDADLMFVGEAPGYHEDRQGTPFVGQAGKVLEPLLGTIGLTRPDVYIANVLKCRPPGNRDPQPDEIAACEGHLFSQVELIRPRVICTLGNFATKLLSGQPHGITRVHGRAQPRRIAGVDLVLYPIFHPAAALYTPAMMETLRADFAQAPGAALDGARGEPWRRCRRRPRPRRPRRSPSQSPNTRSWVSSSPEETEQAGRGRGGACLRPGDVVHVAGELGVGKTVFVRGACRALGVEGPVTSPTYTVGNLYSTASGPRRPSRPLPLGRASRSRRPPTSSRTSTGTICFVEWPEAGAGVLPEPRLVASVRVGEGDARLIELRSHDTELLRAIGDPLV